MVVGFTTALLIYNFRSVSRTLIIVIITSAVEQNRGAINSVPPFVLFHGTQI